MKIKTRFAPSPTGYLHVGGARTALYSWLFARNHGGEFVLRIEDTDLERSTPEAIEAIMDGMNWLSLEWDEGPYYQTKRFDRYTAVIDQMLEEGTAYKCYCSKERLEALREDENQRDYIYVLGKRSGILGEELAAEKVYVRVLDQNDSYAAIEEGALDADAEVIVSETAELNEWDIVRYKE